MQTQSHLYLYVFFDKDLYLYVYRGGQDVVERFLQCCVPPALPTQTAEEEMGSKVASSQILFMLFGLRRFLVLDA
jgi:hypothetical protein